MKISKLVTVLSLVSCLAVQANATSPAEEFRAKMKAMANKASTYQQENVTQIAEKLVQSALNSSHVVLETKLAVLNATMQSEIQALTEAGMSTAEIICKLHPMFCRNSTNQ